MSNHSSNNSRALLSVGVETLFSKSRDNTTPYEYLIIGSGYGGSIAADHLALLLRDQPSKKVCVLERGREFLPGAFPNSLDEAPTEVRLVTPNGIDAKGNAEGLYDIRLGDDLNVLQANGLGGGSLINAGVMERPNPKVFSSAKWGGLTALHEKLEPAYRQVEHKLGVTVNGEKNTISRHSRVNTSGVPNVSEIQLKKFESLKKLQTGSKKASFREPGLSISMSTSENSIGQPLNQCQLCGNCASGCNFGAKNSLDENLLVRASLHNCEIYTGATVLSFDRTTEGEDDLWLVNIAHTDNELRGRQAQKSYQVKTKNLIVSAGSLGSTELLLRSQNPNLKFSNQLGKQFSANGDMIFVAYEQDQKANAVAQDVIPEAGKEIGPTITGMIEYHDDRVSGIPIVFQEMAVPASLKFIFSEMYTTSKSIRSLMSWDWSKHDPKNPDPAQLNQAALSSTSLYAAMGADNAQGTLELSSTSEYSEGTIQVQWKSIRNSPLLHAQEQALKKMSAKSKLGGEILPNPIWKLMPDELMFLLNNKKGSPLTVHPLGGCAMGDDINQGVCDEFGRVYDAASTKPKDLHRGLFVLDGALIPNALGINPALTIAALTQRAVENIGQLKQQPLKKPVAPRQFIRSPENKATIDTEIEITERLTGFWTLPSDTGDLRKSVIEITLWTKPKAIAQLIGKVEHQGYSELAPHQFQIDEENQHPITKYPTSLLRIYYLEDWQVLRDQDPRVQMGEQQLSAAAQYEGTIEGVISVLECQATNPLTRLVRGFIAWFPNRGLRDIYQQTFPKPWEASASLPRFSKTFASFTHAGAERVFRYHINVNRVLKQADFSQLNFKNSSQKGDSRENVKRNLGETWDEKYSIIGEKKLRYARASNPWRQLSAVRLRKFPTNRSYQASKLKYIKQYLFSKYSMLLKNLNARYNDKRFVSLAFIILSPFAFMAFLTQTNAWLVVAVLALITISLLAGLQYMMRRHRDKHNYGKIWLNLDTNYLAKIGVPLINITKQQNQVHALSDITSLVAYLSRIVFGIHFYSFRKPDAAPPRKIDRRPHSVPGLPQATIHKLSVGEIPSTEISELPAGTPVHIELTEYSKPENKTQCPILLIHGYSSSSTSFSHSSLPNSLARHFFEEGRTVWLLDMRTSSALASARHPWKFEEAAEVDIPMALDFINKKHGGIKVDVLAHCMGAAMLGMAILQESKKDRDASYQCWKKEYATPEFYTERINRIALSQATPTPRFTPDNNFRAFITSHIKQLIPNNYQFLPTINEPIYSDLLDRLLYTLPYPDTDYYCTNPRGFSKRKQRTPFSLTRHRMDALYGQTFEATNLNKATLEHIDDIFGPLHVDTVLQAGYFARKGVITNAKGQNIYVSKTKLKRCWSSFPTFSLHCKYNGLLDYSTGKKTQSIFQEAGVNYTTELIQHKRYGHQDSLLADSAHIDIFPHFSRFFNTEIEEDKASKSIDPVTQAMRQTWIIEPPRYGPVIIGQERKSDEEQSFTDLKVLFGLDKARADQPDFYALVPVIKQQNYFKLDIKDGESLQSYLQNKNKIEPTTISKNNGVEWLSFNIEQEHLKSLIVNTKNSEKELVRGALIIIGYLDVVTMQDKSETMEHAFGDNSQGLPYVILEQSVDALKDKMSTDVIHTKLHNEKQYDFNIEDVLTHFFDSNTNQADIFSQGLLSTAALKNAIIDTAPTNLATRRPLSFAVGSCQYPAGMFDSVVAFNSYRDLAHKLSSNEVQSKPDFIALLGDQIYADATAGILDPNKKFDRYSSQYLSLYSNKHVRSVLRRLPMYAMLDDHEIHNNFQTKENHNEIENLTDDAKSQRQEHVDSIHEGLRTYLSFQRGQTHNRNDTNSLSIDLSNNRFWYTFAQKGYEFFMLDTRTQRSARDFDSIADKDTQIIGKTQQNELERWLKKHADNPAPKFIISASMLLPRHRVNHAGDTLNLIRSDSWDGYPTSLHRVLGLIHELKIKNIIFLSGDEHMNCYCKIQINQSSKANLEASSTVIRSVHCSGLYTPFPFANARAEDLVGEMDQQGIVDNFSFEHQDLQQKQQNLSCKTTSSYDFNAINFDDASPIIVEPCVLPINRKRQSGDGNGFTVISIKI